MIRYLRPLSPLLYLLTGLMVSFMATEALAQSSLTAQVDRAQVSEEETLTLQVRYTGQAQAAAPDFSQLEQNFDIVSQQRSNQFRNINGNISAFTEWTLVIAPLRTGQLLIPSFEYNGHFSDAIQVEVTEAQTVPGELKDIFLETALDQSQVYVQQQVILTYRLFTTRSIDSLDAVPLQINGVRIEELPQARYQRRINGTTYGVLEVPYALFPQSSETFTIPSQRWTLRVVTAPSRHGIGFGAGHYELRRLLTDEKRVEVNAQPDAFPHAATWLPAQQVSLSQQWSQPPTELRVGEPVTRTLTLEAQGLTAAQLPPLPTDQNTDEFRVYPDQPQQDNTKTSEGVTSTRSESMAIVPKRSGELTLPAVEVQWWDTQSNQLRTAKLPAMQVNVKPASSSSETRTTLEQEPQVEADLPLAKTDPQHAAPQSSDSGEAGVLNNRLWPLLAGVFALLWLIFLLLWWRTRTKNPNKTTETTGKAARSLEKQAFERVRASTAIADPTQLRRDLLEWSRTRWPEQPPLSLQALADKTSDDDVRRQLAALDAEIYGTSRGDFNHGDLVEALAKWRNQKAPNVEGKTASLKPLY